MSNQTVNDCEGILYDSEAGTTSGYYDHNENYTFTICVPGASNVILSFSSFCTEAGFDSIRFFDGASINATQIGNTVSGTNSPGTIVSSGNCLTINFISDASKSCTGWTASWTTTIEQPNIPKITVSPNPASCNIDHITIQFSNPIHCDSVYKSAFTITGPFNPGVASINSNCSSDSIQTADIYFNQPLIYSGNYTLTYQYNIKDLCGNIWSFALDTIFYVSGCPLYVYILPNQDSVCAGSCTNLKAVATGGSSTNYTYLWSTGSTDSATSVCPDGVSSYQVTVSDGFSTADSNITLYTLALPLTQNDTTICQSDSSFMLQATPPGGIWSGNGITDTLSGLFNPEISIAGKHLIIYHDKNYCTDSLYVNVLTIDIGNDEAACPSNDTFSVGTYLPSGGYWSGSIIDSNGNYLSNTTGSFEVTYTAPNACYKSKYIHIDSIDLNIIDTLCESADTLPINFSPIGGTWSGNGIVDNYYGYFLASDAGSGVHELTYAINGCSVSDSINITEIDAGVDFFVCYYQSPVTLPTPSPKGGVWSGAGITDSIAGIYNPNITKNSNHNDYLTYSVNGCTDEIMIKVRITQLKNVDTAIICKSSEIYTLHWWNTGLFPNDGDGIFYGEGINYNGLYYEFHPDSVESGTYTFYYENHECMDSMTMIVIKELSANDTTLCYTDIDFQILEAPTIGYWNGPGITDSILGYFNPIVADTGSNLITYSYMGCSDTLYIDVLEPSPISFMVPDSSICYKDTNLIVSALPSGGNLTINGIGDSVINPIVDGSGMFSVSYSYDIANCKVTDSTQVHVKDPLQAELLLSSDTICYGEPINITIINPDSLNNAISLIWLNNAFIPATEKIDTPTTQTQYIAWISDGCSEDIFDTATVYVHSAMQVTVNTNDTLCANEVGFAKVSEISNYIYTWEEYPNNDSNILYAPVGNTYNLIVTDSYSKCEIQKAIYLPGASTLSAYFITSPNNDHCIIATEQVTLLDLSLGGTKGIWNWGDKNIDTYSVNSPKHIYKVNGNFEIVLTIQNDLGCTASFTTDICLIDTPSVFIPQAFTPNNDGINDQFYISALGVKSFSLSIYNRWGERIYFSNAIENRWDGTHNGKLVEQGIYIYNLYISWEDSGKPPLEQIDKLLLMNK